MSYIPVICLLLIVSILHYVYIIYFRHLSMLNGCAPFLNSIRLLTVNAGPHIISTNNGDPILSIVASHESQIEHASDMQTVFLTSAHLPPQGRINSVSLSLCLSVCLSLCLTVCLRDVCPEAG